MWITLKISVDNVENLLNGCGVSFLIVDKFVEKKRENIPPHLDNFLSLFGQLRPFVH
jgi:hypothetical protein